MCFNEPLAITQALWDTIPIATFTRLVNIYNSILCNSGAEEDFTYLLRRQANSLPKQVLPNQPTCDTDLQALKDFLMHYEDSLTETNTITHYTQYASLFSPSIWLQRNFFVCTYTDATLYIHNLKGLLLINLPTSDSPCMVQSESFRLTVHDSRYLVSAIKNLLKTPFVQPTPTGHFVYKQKNVMKTPRHLPSIQLRRGGELVNVRRQDTN